MTSMPPSSAATAICSAPLEWPSRPGLATSGRGGHPSSCCICEASSRRPVDPHDVVVATERRLRGLGEPVDTDHELLTRFDVAHARGVAAYEATLHLLDRLERATERQHVVELGLCAVDEFGGLRFDDVRA